MLYLDFQCPCCKSRRQTEPDAKVILCRSCGALLLTDDSGAWAKGIHIELDKNPEIIPRKRFLERRQAAVVAKMEHGRRSREPDQWRMYAYEAKALDLAMDPELVPEHTNAAQLQWLQDEINLAELMTFDPTLRDLLERFKMAARKVRSTADVPVVREMFTLATNLYRTLLRYERCPAGLKDQEADVYGKDMTLATLESFRRTVGSRAVDTLISRAFPERPPMTMVRCQVCQGTITDLKPGATRAMCPSCGTLVTL